jgi:soluble lytic murein transglycosylase-like protein
MWVTPTAGQKYETLFRSATDRSNLPDGLLSRVAYQESRYNPQAFNASSGASGIMQIVPKWHPGVDPFNPEEAIPYAARYLRQQYDTFGDWTLALAAYNAGPGNVEKYNGIPPFSETINYVSEILADVRDQVLQWGAKQATVGFGALVAAILAVLTIKGSGKK